MIERIIILSLVTIGLCCPFWEDMVFEKQGDWIKDRLGKLLAPHKNKGDQAYYGEFWAKPLFGCYVCATFWYGLLQCYVYGWPLYLCLPAMGLSAVISLMQKE